MQKPKIQTSETTPETVMIQNKYVPLTNLDDIADFINKTYLNDGKQETKPTAESDAGTTKNSANKNSSEHPSKEKAKK